MQQLGLELCWLVTVIVSRPVDKQKIKNYMFCYNNLHRQKKYGTNWKKRKIHND